VTRKLLYIPIIHTQADMGALREPVKRLTIEKLGKRIWEEKIQSVEMLWDTISSEIEGWKLSYSRVRLYQDGLPICGREMDIVRDLAGSGSRNHQLLLRLSKKGAILMGTESPELLLQEYGLMQQALAAGTGKEAARIREAQKELGRNLLQQRDKFIASRISNTLKPRETGILFLGMLHSVEKWLDKDIDVSYPICRPVPKRVTDSGNR
jgi:hypothetical protein